MSTDDIQSMSLPQLTEAADLAAKAVCKYSIVLAMVAAPLWDNTSINHNRKCFELYTAELLALTAEIQKRRNIM